MRPRIAILALGAANRRSIGGAIERAGGSPLFVDRPEALGKVDAIVVPGVANFGFLANALDDRSLRQPMLDAIARKTPYLGICAGFQLLFDASDEAPGARGLGIFPGIVRHVSGPKSPHMGWNGVEPITPEGGVSGWAYFAHSYAAPATARNAVAVTSYGDDFASVGTQERVVGVQFHPERSGRDGAEFLERFVAGVMGDHAR
jgi:imidazole glycerol phosphate synthase glutamine amidotransferase subunit